MTPKQFQQQLQQMERQVQEAINTTIPQQVAQEGVRLLKQNFANQSWFGEPWQEVKRRETHAVTYKTKGGKTKQKMMPAGKGKRGKDKILHDTGNLQRSISATQTPGRVVFSSATPYGNYINEGTPKMPKRQFFGEHPQLRQMIVENIKKNIQQALNIQ